MHPPAVHPAWPVVATALRRFWWVGAAAAVGGIVLVLALSTRHRAPASGQSSAATTPAPPSDDTTPEPSPASLPDFEVAATSVHEGEATWYKVPVNSLPQRRAWPGEFTAASDQIAPETYVRVRRTDSKGDPDKTVVVRVTDHGVHRKGTILDLSRPAARALGMVEDGEVRVRVEVLALKNATTDKPVGKKTDPPLNPKASQITDQPTATRKQERENARAKEGS